MSVGMYIHMYVNRGGIVSIPVTGYSYLNRDTFAAYFLAVIFCSVGVVTNDSRDWLLKLNAWRILFQNA
jgi:hypothetical protein